ncbi:hypothetical protein BgiMline_030494 [Biomphalaria glabrata]
MGLPYVGDGGSQGLCHIKPYWFHNDAEESDLGGGAYSSGFPDAVQMMKDCSSFTCSFLVEKDVTEI